MRFRHTSKKLLIKRKNMFTDLPQSSNDLYQQVLRECLIALKFNTFLDNYDSERFENVSNNNSMLFDANTYANQFRWFHNNYEKIYDAYKILGDEYSKKMYKLLANVQTRKTTDPKGGRTRTEPVQDINKDAIALFSSYMAEELPKGSLKNYIKQLQNRREVAKNPPFCQR